MKRNSVFVVEECVKGKWVPVCAEVSENIATRMMRGLQEFDLSNDERYRIKPYTPSESTGGG